MVWLLGRTLVENEADLSIVHALQKQYTLTSLSTFLGQSRSTPSSMPEQTSSMPHPIASDEAAFFDELGEGLQNNPPPRDESLLKTFAHIGVGPGRRPTVEQRTHHDILAALHAAPEIAEQQLNEKIIHLGTRVNGWRINFTTGRYGADFLLRAAVAKRGLGATVPEEALYPVALMDNTGQFLTGEKRYVLHFQAGHLPPVDAFWSLSLYSAKDFFFVENPIHRYSVGDRTSGLTYNSDGSLDVYIQHDAPLGKESNWLPAPPDTFLLMLRLYQPKEDAVSGAYQYPPVKLTS